MIRLAHSPRRFPHQPFAAELVALAWPLCVSLLSYSVMTLVDTLFVSTLGTEALASIGLATVLAFFTLSFAMGTFRAGKIAISQAMGAGQPQAAVPLVGAMLALAFGLSIATAGAGQLVAWALPELTTDRAVGELAAQYLSVRTLGAPISVVAFALGQARLAVGDSKSAMRASLVANLANIALNALLIFELQWGLFGAALGSILAQGLQVAVLYRAQRRAGFGLRRWCKADALAVWRFGFPGGLEALLDSGAFAALMVVLAQLPTEHLAAHQIALHISHFSFLPLHAIAEAASVLTANAVGGERDSDVQPICHTARNLALLVAGSLAAVMVTIPRGLCAPFSQDEQVLRLSAQLLWAFIPLSLANAVYSSYRGGLRGTGDVVFTTRVTVLCAWLLTPPLAYLWGLALGWGVVGTWFALNLEIGCGALWVCWRLRQSGWKKAAEKSRDHLAMASSKSLT